MSDNFQQVTHRVYQNMALASVDTFSAIKAVFTTYFCGLHTLTIDDCQAWLCRSSHTTPNLFTQGRVYRFPSFIPTPFVKMIVHTVVVRIFLRQICPLATRPQYVQYRVHY